jgi:thiamine-monophosphate kinase
MIDLSDGLSTDLGHICDESAVGAEISADAIPLAQIDKPTRKVDLQSALHGGDDYELLFTTPKAKRVPSRIAGVAITQIGQVTRRRPVILMTSDGGRIKLRPQGWEHFKG